MNKLIKLALGLLLAFPAGLAMAQTAGLPSPAATTSTLGSIKPDNSSITISPTGTISAVSSAPSPQYIAPQAISGCGVEYVTGLTYTVGACTYSINGVIYNSPLSNITLATADPTNPRIDVIFVDTTQVVQQITGTPGATPQQPVVDPSTQLQLTFILVPASSTTPANTTLVDIYLEGTEWTGATGGTNAARVNLTSTNNPYSGTHDTEFGTSGTVTTTTYSQYTDPSSGTVNLSNYNALVFYMRNKAAWPSTRSVTVQWYNGSTAKGTAIVLSSGAYGFNSTTNTTSYQQVSIPVATFGLAGVPVSTLRFTVSGTGTALTGFYLDQVTLQGGNGGVVLPSTLMNFKGTWSASATYSPNDLVISGNVGYVAIAANTNQAVTTTTFWSPLAPSAGVSGGVHNVTASSYTVLSTDSGKLLTFTPTAGATVSLPAATTAGFGAGAVFHLVNTGIGTVVVNPVTSTISGIPSIQLQPAQTAALYSDGANYQISAAFINYGTNDEAAGSAIPIASIVAAGFHDVTATGWGALASLSGFCRSDTAYGASAMTALVCGDDNTAVGVDAMFSATNGANNTAVGSGALYPMNGGQNNTAVGMGASGGLTTGGATTSLGFNAGLGPSTTSEWVAIGDSAMSGASGGGNSVAIGAQALTSTTVNNNTAVGGYALQQATSAAGVDAFGYEALYSDTTGGFNSAFGQNALRDVTTGTGNVAFGNFSGYNSGTPLRTISTSTFIGGGASASTDGLSNMIVIGNTVQGTASNQVTLGNSSITSYVFGGTVIYPVVRGTVTLTTATSDVATVTGATSSSNCQLTPTNATAAAATTIAYVSSVAANAVTITHAATVASGGTMNVSCTIN